MRILTLTPTLLSNPIHEVARNAYWKSDKKDYYTGEQLRENAIKRKWVLEH